MHEVVTDEESEVVEEESAGYVFADAECGGCGPAGDFGGATGDGDVPDVEGEDVEG